MMENFKDASTLADGFVFGVASALAGIPVFIIAPPSGGKTVIIRSIERWLEKYNYKYKQISRIGLKGLKELSLWINTQKVVTLTNDDFSLIGSSDYMVEKMAEIIASLSYDKRYIDYGNNIVIECASLGFISGLQPLWLQNVMQYRVWDTHVREKFVRFYLVPYKSTKDLNDIDAINRLVNGLSYNNEGYETRVNKELLEALILQLGYTRGVIYYNRLASALTLIVDKEYFHKVCSFLARRLALEAMIITREITEKGYNIDVGWRAYTMLYWCMRMNNPSKIDLCIRLGVTPRSVERLVEETISKGWIAVTRNSSTVRYVINPSIREMFGW